jgi:hypothetical protein
MTTAASTSMESDEFSNAFVFTGGAPLSVQDLLNPVPGLGFDFAHLAAINHDLGLKAFIDPATQARLAVAERLLRESPRISPGFFFLDGGGSFVLPAPTEQQPPIIIVQQPSPAVAAPVPQPAVAPQSEEALSTSTPLPDEGEFTLVLINGTRIQAVAFTRVHDKIVYITTEGTRRTIAVKDLDSEATLRVNQERGTPLQFPL